MNVQDVIANLAKRQAWLTDNADILGDTPIYGTTLYPGTAERCALIVAYTPGKWTKSAHGSTMYFNNIDSPYELSILRDDVCEKVPTGRTVTRSIGHTTYTDVEEQEYEWKCSPILAHLEKAGDSD